METLSDFDFDAQPKRQSVYDWDLWADGEIRRLTAGEDYECTARSLVQLIYRRANERGLKAQVRKEVGPGGDVVSVVFRMKPTP